MSHFVIKKLPQFVIRITVYRTLFKAVAICNHSIRTLWEYGNSSSMSCPPWMRRDQRWWRHQASSLGKLLTLMLIKFTCHKQSFKSKLVGHTLATVHTRSQAELWHFVRASPSSEGTPFCSKLFPLRTLGIVKGVVKTWEQKATISRRPTSSNK